MNYIGNEEEVQIYNQLTSVDASNEDFPLTIYYDKDGFCRFEMTYPSVDHYLAYIYKLD